MRLLLALLLASSPALAADDQALGPAGIPASRFALPNRPVAPIVSDRWRDEDSRERLGEAAHVIGWMGIGPGKAVADIGAGSGYYAVRVAAAVGPGGRVLAQDVVPDYVARLRARIVREKLANVSVGMGETGDPRLPPRSVDVALLIHMYHEITQPFALMTNLVPSLRPGGRVGIVDVDDATERHGTPLGLLSCELAAVGYRQVSLSWLLVDPPRSEYLAIFEPPPTPVSPESVRSCKG